MTDLRLNGVNLPRPTEMSEIQAPGSTSESGATSQFMGSLKDAISSINEAQTGASKAVEELVTGQSQNIHQTMVALQQADVSFQLMMQVRNKLISAYEEIQRMQV
ncbi:MAG TPA: flagellar hook-basal body complex protein FliE [Nitrospiraceae bacterium]|jgi:flagellar hook-basal body complex protein FliE|nr:flagellar hook-basal body complex protein FliE [Nitrospiraceae bacterium]